MKTNMLPGLVLLSLLPTLGHAEDASALAAGRRVRLTSSLAGGRPLVGTVLSLDDDALTLTNEDHQTLKLPRTAVRQLEVSWGRKSRWWQGMLVGAAVGAAIGAGEGASCDSYGCYTRSQNMTYGSLGMAAIGALIGKHLKSDRWAILESPPSATRRQAMPVGSCVGARSVALSASVSF